MTLTPRSMYQTDWKNVHKNYRYAHMYTSREYICYMIQHRMVIIIKSSRIRMKVCCAILCQWNRYIVSDTSAIHKFVLNNIWPVPYLKSIQLK